MPVNQTRIKFKDVERCAAFESLITKYYGPYSRYKWKYAEKNGDDTYVGVSSNLKVTKAELRKWTKKTKFLCLNDVMSNRNSQETALSIQHVQKVLEDHYPNKSSFEL